MLAYVLSAVPAIGVKGIWAAVPIGWVLADLTGLLYDKDVIGDECNNRGFYSVNVLLCGKNSNCYRRNEK